MQAYAIQWKDRTFRLYEGKMSFKGDQKTMDKMYGFGPVIEIKNGSEIEVLDLRNRLPSHCFSHVFHDQWNGRIIALIEPCIEGPSAEFLTWITEDSGESWFPGGNLQRPSPGFPPSELYTIFVDNLGKGEAWFRLNADQFSSEGKFAEDMRRGQELIYKASTIDGGRNWLTNDKPYLINGVLEATRETP